MTRTSIHEYAAAQRERYARASRTEKQHILDHVTAVIAYHRKAAIRLLRRAPHGQAAPRSGRPRLYTAETAAGAAMLW
ncbi:MAG: transposase, partial [Candidatus Rokuibacteriota bacterium]